MPKIVYTSVKHTETFMLRSYFMAKKCQKEKFSAMQLSYVHYLTHWELQTYTQDVYN